MTSCGLCGKPLNEQCVHLSCSHGHEVYSHDKCWTKYKKHWVQGRGRRSMMSAKGIRYSCVVDKCGSTVQKEFLKQNQNYKPWLDDQDIFLWHDTAAPFWSDVDPYRMVPKVVSSIQKEPLDKIDGLN